MRAFRYLSLLTIGLGPVFAQSNCPQGGTTIFFSNGLNTDTAHALQSAINLSAAVKLRLAQTSNTASPGCLSFGWAPDLEFVESNSSIVSWANLLAQLEVAAGQEGVVLTPDLLWGWMTAESPLPPPNWFTSFVGASVTSVVSAVQPDVRKQLSLYEEELAAGNNVIVIAHSQGNLYVNEVYNLLSDEQKKSFSVVAVATPASAVAGNGPWFTLVNDIIALVPGHLSENITNDLPSACLNGDRAGCHNFDNSYLAGNNTAPTILDAAISAIPLSQPKGFLFAQTDDAATSAPSWYGDNWYHLGTGFFGQLQSLTVNCYTNGGDFSSTGSITLQEFTDSSYSVLTNTYQLSGVNGNPSCGPVPANVTFTNLNITLLPRRYYRLYTYDNLQNASVRLLGTKKGFAMYNDFIYGTGRVEYDYAFYPYLVSQSGAGVGAVSVRGMLDGSVWAGAVNYVITCDGQSIGGSAVSHTFTKEPVGGCAISNINGGPLNSTLSSVTPSTSQTLMSGGTITYTLNYASKPPTAGFVMSSGTHSATDGQTLSVDTSTGNGTVQVNFDASTRSSAVNGDSVVGWTWAINGTTVANTSSFVRSLTTGKYTVSLVVTDNRGVQSSPVQGQITIATSNPPISAQVTVLYSFPLTYYGPFASHLPGNGENPLGALTLGTDGLIYGTVNTGGLFIDYAEADCYNSGCGTLFKIDTSGNFTLLHQFMGAEGAFPSTSLVQGKDGYFYGMANSGGDPTNCASNGGLTGCGTIFRVDSSGKFTLLHSFSGGAEGARPVGGLIQAPDGFFYGTASSGGNLSCSPGPIWVNPDPGCGTIFKMDTAGNVTVLHQFGGGSLDGQQPGAGLTLGSDGYFYGTTVQGGSSNGGTIFKMDSDGNVAVLHSFVSPTNAAVSGLIGFSSLVQANDGLYYGTTSGEGNDFFGPFFGTLFKIDGDTGAFTTLFTFPGTAGSLLGNNPLVRGSDGGLYGATLTDDVHHHGTLFWMDTSGNLKTLFYFSGPDGSNPNGSLLQIGHSFYGTTVGGGANQIGAIYRADIH